MLTAQLIEHAPRVQIFRERSDDYDFRDSESEQTLDDVATFIRGLRRQAQWWLCPYGCWTEADGSGVIFDRSYRPIARVKRGGTTEIVPPDEFISYVRQRWFHRGFGWSPDAATRELVTRIIAKYWLAPELRRRLQLQRRGALPRWDRLQAAA